jgi:HEAT repeat protein
VVVEKICQPYGPIYQGKPLSVWLKQYDLPKLPNGSIDWKTFGPRWRETNKIVQQAGTNAIPTLLRLLQEESIKKHNVDNNGQEADMAFAALGVNAKDSVPSLIEIYGRNPAARGDVLYSLNCIGTNADVPIDWLLPKLKDPDPQIRAGIAYVLGQIHTKSERAIPALIQCLSDSSSHVRADAALALGSCGADAKPAIPQLIALLNDKGNGVRNCAVFAIKQIDPDAAANAGLK